MLFISALGTYLNNFYSSNQGRLAEPCDVCFDARLFCCGEGGALAAVAACGHACCVESAARWIDTQVNELQRGVGEVLCFACPAPLTGAEVSSRRKKKLHEA